MAKQMIRIHDLATNEIIDREMNEEEIIQQQEDIAKANQEKTEATTKEAARQAVLAKLGLTAEEAAALLA